jgi:alkylation response protein AidB-like acyl-CoA dehydrogenase
VPAANLIGEENAGFRAIMLNFNDERLHMAASSTAFARVCLEEAAAYARERKTFGKTLSQHQVIRHKLVDMAMRVEATQAMLDCLPGSDLYQLHLHRQSLPRRALIHALSTVAPASLGMANRLDN